MPTRIPPVTLIALLAASVLFLAACQTADPPPAETVLRLHLHDSLSRYDKVVVQLLDHEDPDKVVATLYDGVMRNPGSDIPGYPLRSLAGKPLTVKISGFLALGQLALETVIEYVDGTKTVRHTSLPPPTPVNWLVKLAPSAGAVMVPAFDKDNLNYTVNVPANTASLTFSQQAASSAATVSVNGETVAFGGASRPIAIGTAAQTVKVLVTDKSTGTAVTRQYTLTLVPAAQPGLYLSSLKPSVGAIQPEFSSTTQIYSLILPAGIDTVSFVITPVDPKTNMTIAGKAIFSGSKSEVFKISKESTFPIPIEVNRGSDMGFYQVTVELAP